ncbi:bifunctional proline dehydrogenase/L-glutamate gamma-semialdehyde dehydrogenase PutA [Halioxenophilus sp. WMMB6]|uniref:bifunctional proline dehydrogenase/L-glutamate gamma-semialdehyde dehydrogenase PutA n=1 Tax=Halioxenophilus sp. WMMB6 TaxID=3073815 RepID=UPI00295F4ADD|nr:bifunctional proline dehydrogenase/L-glutamate gamma-semialdehyde dehydrogenase PutA [Halioxenophilus sp. WMMB6]
MNAPFLSQSDVLIRRLHDYYSAPEDDVARELLAAAKPLQAALVPASVIAEELIAKVRERTLGKGGVDALLNEYSLSSEEGIALMCLAEALLRVPDADTAKKLIRDKLQGGNWISHAGKNSSVFVNAATWGLVVTGRFLRYSDTQASAHKAAGKLISRLGEAGIHLAVRRAMGIMGNIFVMGQEIGSALTRARGLEAKGFRYSYDMLGEGARTRAAAADYFESYRRAINAIGQSTADMDCVDSAGISVKLSALHPRYEWANRDKVLEELTPLLLELALQAKSFNIGLTVDAEEADRLELSLEVIAAVARNPQLEKWDGFGFAVQAYQKRARIVIQTAANIARSTGRRLMIRLVKGAYWDSEIKQAQMEGLSDYPVFTRKLTTDLSYLVCAAELLAHRDCLFPQFATHNANTVAAILSLSQERSGYEFQRLHGMGEELYDEIMKREKIACRIYAPVGNHTDLLAYLVRRLLENGANGSFVNNIIDESLSTSQLVANPYERMVGEKVFRNSAIPLAPHLYGEGRPNSRGVNLSHPVSVAGLNAGIDAAAARFTMQSECGVRIRNPADLQETVGFLEMAPAEAVESSLVAVSRGASDWAEKTVEERCHLISHFAELLEEQREQLLMLCIREAGKTIPDSLAELREAVDFCHYYVQQARAGYIGGAGYKPHGVVLCISPWNFPLAIFTGQIVAALVAGNAVVAKPAEQTGLIAEVTVQLMYQAGIPRAAVQLLCLTGTDTGGWVVPDPRINAVMFTGSTATARRIHATLSKRTDAPVPMIAETGGQNAMIVDSSALPEQVVDDVIRSGFQSAGQRCSALRVLFLQEDIADAVIAMIRGAMESLVIGNPALLTTDIGPVIDRVAAERLQAHLDRMCGIAHNIFQTRLPETLLEGHYVAPALLEIPSVSVLEGEVFGPMVHVVRFRAGEIDSVVDEINSSGFGLTLGVHSRIQATVDQICSRAEVGNIYVNRDMIGAVVGVQPFGGRGLSGTGPKAGGPLYLTRLVKGGRDSFGSELKKVADPLCQFSQLIQEIIGANPVDPDVISARLQARGAQLDTLLHDIFEPISLPGPTGESNQLLLEPRGRILMHYDGSDSQHHAWLTLAAASLLGNSVELCVPGHWRDSLACLSSALRMCGRSSEVIFLSNESPELTSAKYGMVVMCPGSSLISLTAERLASASGSIISILAEIPGVFYGHRFVEEKTITVNTTASGGNTSLMMLSDV